ncbi:response regulator [Flavobacterium sp. Sd200]|uniref:response regulator n=1 Tax=Flavobacterium sp. Sd200 TaxID=2692211 RepID=UPI0013708F97|nr:response regulator [Flavobacterium sp. Sd200]MXN91134.1 response regulator [Flavobacterium sp. Sd200]
MLKNVYLCDDDPDDRELFQNALQQISPDLLLTASGDGEELLLQLYDSFSSLPDIIFLDINMPGKDGLETLREIKSHLHLYNIPVVIYSTSSQSDTVHATYSLGAKSYLVKPDSFNVLKKALTMLIDNQSTSTPKFLIT